MVKKIIKYYRYVNFVRLLESLITIFLACYTIYRPHASYLFLFHLSLVIHDL